jgi:dipeptidyl aminopeptidase/acylaminoacyl peptidase
MMADLRRDMETGFARLEMKIEQRAADIMKWSFVFLITVFSACGDGTGPGRVVAGVDLDELFAAPTAAEVAAVSDAWDGRDVSVQALELLRVDTVTVGIATQVIVRIVSHTVGGVVHYGAVVVPAGAPAAGLPLLVLGHGGDDGIDVDDALLLLNYGLGDAVDDFVFVVPSFRSEPLVFHDVEYRSGGTPSPWDRDVDDALALLSAAADIAPEADTSRIGIVGFSRGAGVGLLMAVREPRIDAVVEFFGPTDFFDTFVQEVVEEALLGMPRNLPGLADLDAQFIQPLKRAELTIQEVRLELLRRSPVYFVDRLPQVQIHHGTADSTVSVSQAERLIEVMEQAGRQPPGFEPFLYEGGGHNPLTLFGSLDRTIGFLRRALSILAAVS